jgi:hypothetical protein
VVIGLDFSLSSGWDLERICRFPARIAQGKPSVFPGVPFVIGLDFSLSSGCDLDLICRSPPEKQVLRFAQDDNLWVYS